MSNKEHISEEKLRAEAPLLFGIEKQELKAPEGYFEDVSEEVYSKLDSPVVQIPQQSNKHYVWKIAAGIAALVGMYFLLQSDVQPTGSELSADGIHFDVEQDMDYLLEIEDEILYEVLAEQNAQEENETLDPRIEFLLEEGIEWEDLVGS